MSNHRWLVTYSVVRGSERWLKTITKNTACKVLTIELDVFKGRKKGIRWSKPYKQCSLSSFNLLHFFPRPVHPRREATALLAPHTRPATSRRFTARTPEPQGALVSQISASALRVYASPRVAAPARMRARCLRQPICTRIARASCTHSCFS